MVCRKGVLICQRRAIPFVLYLLTLGHASPVHHHNATSKRVTKHNSSKNAALAGHGSPSHHHRSNDSNHVMKPNSSKSVAMVGHGHLVHRHTARSKHVLTNNSSKQLVKKSSVTGVKGRHPGGVNGTADALRPVLDESISSDFINDSLKLPNATNIYKGTYIGPGAPFGNESGSDTVPSIGEQGNPVLSNNLGGASEAGAEPHIQHETTGKTQASSNASVQALSGERRSTAGTPCASKTAFNELDKKVQTAERELLTDTQQMKENEQLMMKDELEAHQLVQEAQKQLDDARRSFEAEQHQLLKVAARWKKNATQLFAKNGDLTRQIDSLQQESFNLRKEQETADRERRTKEASHARRASKASKGHKTHSAGGLHSWQAHQGQAAKAGIAAYSEVERMKTQVTQLEAEKKRLEATAMQYFNEKERYQQESRRLLGDVRSHIGEMHKNSLGSDQQVRTLSGQKEKLKHQLEEADRKLASEAQAKHELEHALAGAQSKLQGSVAAVGQITEEQLEKDAQIQQATYAEVERLKAGNSKLGSEMEQYKAIADKVSQEKSQLQKSEAIMLDQLQKAVAKIVQDKQQLEEKISKTSVQQVVDKYETEKKHLQEQVLKTSTEAMNSRRKAQELENSVQQWKISTNKLQGEREALELSIDSLTSEKEAAKQKQAELAKRLAATAAKVASITAQTQMRDFQVASLAGAKAHQEMDILSNSNQQLQASVSQLTDQLHQLEQTRDSLQQRLRYASEHLAGETIQSQDEATKSWMKKLLVNAEMWKNRARQLRGENMQLREAMGAKESEARAAGAAAAGEGQALSGAMQALNDQKQEALQDSLQAAQQLKNTIVGVAEVAERRLKEGMEAAGITNLVSTNYVRGQFLRQFQDALSKATGF